MEALEKVEQLKAELDALRPIDAAAERRIMQKFRLDWNYHSNKLEGNSLTFGETKALLLHGIAAGAKPLKDYLEVKGHDEAIKWVEEIIKDERPLTETFIRELHTLILKEPYEVDAQTPDGKLTKRMIKVGEYKSQPNHVLTQTGEMFYFAEPFEVPFKMHELVDWFREKKETDFSAVLLAAEFHYKFIRIHPFDDGNGRVARILMNFILMQQGFSPVVIRTEDKENYLLALQQADAGIYEPFFEYIANNLVHSLEIMIRGAKGESIEEPDDLDKELALLEQKVKAIGQQIEVTKNRESLVQVCETSIIPLFIKFLDSREKFDRFYLQKKLFLLLDDFTFANVSAVEIENQIKSKITEETVSIEIRFFHAAFKQYVPITLDFYSYIKIILRFTDYIIEYGDQLRMVNRYSYSLTDSDTSAIVNVDVDRHKRLIAEAIEKTS